MSGTTPFKVSHRKLVHRPRLWAYQNNVVAGTSPTVRRISTSRASRSQSSSTQYMFHVLKMNRTCFRCKRTFPDGAVRERLGEGRPCRMLVAAPASSALKAPDGVVCLDPRAVSATPAGRDDPDELFCQNVKEVIIAQDGITACRKPRRLFASSAGGGQSFSSATCPAENTSRPANVRAGPPEGDSGGRSRVRCSQAANPFVKK